MSWSLVRYVAAIAMGLWALGNLRMVFVYLGLLESPLGLGLHLPFATRSLARSADSAVYSCLLFCVSRGVVLAVAVVAFWIIRWAIQGSLRRLWFRYLAHVLVEIERRSDTSAVQETSGPRFQDAIEAAYIEIASAHAPVSPFGEAPEAGRD